MGRVSWDSIRAEYITGDMSYRELAEKYSVSQSTLTKRAVKEKWNVDKQKNRKKLVTKTVEKINAEKLSNVEKLLYATQAALEKLTQMIDEGIVAEPKDAKQITSALKDIRDILIAEEDKDEKVKIIIGSEGEAYSQ